MSILDEIKAGTMWAECGHCGVRVDSELCEFDDDGEPCRELSPCCDMDGWVYCSRECRGHWMETVIAANTRRQEQIRIARLVFGDDVSVVDASGTGRSGFCGCDREKCEYPGVVELRVPGIEHRITGCMFCRRWGVARGDIESGRWAALCERRGIVVR